MGNYVIRHIITLSILLWAQLAGATGAPRILFDQGHGQQFLIEEQGDLQLSGLAGIMREKGAVVSSTGAPLDDMSLNGVKGVVISGPFAALLPEEVDSVARFIAAGGKVAVMLHIGPPLASLLARLDADHSNFVVHERQNVIDTDINFRVKDMSASPLFAGLKQFSVFGSWALNTGKGGVPIARTSSAAWVDLDGDGVISRGDAGGTFDVVVSGVLGSGSFVVFGDDAIFQNRFLDEDNRKLAGNLASWLIGP